MDDFDIVVMDIDDIVPYENNPRINDKAVDKVAKSIKAYGWQQPIVVDKDNVVIVGHTRLLAAKKLKLTKVPVHVAKDLSPEKVKAYRLDDNKTSEYAEWDMGKLKIEFSELKDLSYDLSQLAFDSKEISKLLEDDGGEEDLEKMNQPKYIVDSYVVIVECKDEKEQESTYNALKENYKCRVSTL